MMTSTESVLIPARFGRGGSKVHLAAGVIDEHRGRKSGRLVTSTPACGVYTRPGSGWPLSLGSEITCSKCAALGAA